MSGKAMARRSCQAGCRRTGAAGRGEGRDVDALAGLQHRSGVAHGREVGVHSLQGRAGGREGNGLTAFQPQTGNRRPGET
jgi:hypothetical protein